MHQNSLAIFPIVRQGAGTFFAAMRRFVRLEIVVHCCALAVPVFFCIPFSWNLRLNLFKKISQRVSIISFICRRPSHVLTRPSRLSSLYCNRLNELADMPHSISVNKKMNQNNFSFISMSNYRKISFSKEKKNHQPLMISSKSAHHSTHIQEVEFAIL